MLYRPGELLMVCCRLQNAVSLMAVFPVLFYTPPQLSIAPIHMDEPDYNYNMHSYVLPISPSTERVCALRVIGWQQNNFIKVTVASNMDLHATLKIAR